jgi:hypothetical protein
MSNYRTKLDGGVNNVGYTIVRIAPIIAPIPALATLLDATGYAVYAWFVVAGVELTGYAIGEQLVRAIRLGVLSLKISAIPLLIYGLVIEGLMLGYKVIPAWAGWQAGTVDTSHAIQASVGILYPFFTLAGAVLFAFHEYLQSVEHDKDYDKETERERDTLLWQDDRDYRNREREVKLSLKVSKTQPKMLSVTVSPEVDTFAESVDESVDESLGKQIVRYFVDHPGALLEDVAGHVGKSVPVVSKEIKGLVDNGALHKEKQGRRQVVTVNGNHEAYLAS